jgi:mono/diheme cytochrome c family protein
MRHETGEENMSTRGRAIKSLLIALVLFALAVALMMRSMMRHGFSSMDEPTAMEAIMARSMRRFSAPADLRRAENPVMLTPAVLSEARAHFADHCAICHGNDGKGSEMGKRMYPRTPDMTLQPTQEQSDGELFATIENGVRLTGMPAFGNGTADSAYGSWTLVHFIRSLPKITPAELDEMAKLNPKSPEEYERMKAEEAFLAGDDTTHADSQKEHH